ncbi:MAG TPA: DUF1501 domain-containing protein [Xanthomonadaceae bacterium]|nr:DUF1501 domain-containing protein [Xanthomonadaceae bacterium]
MSRSNRREFLQRSLCALAGSAAFGSMFGKLALAQSAANPGRMLLGSDYRALVCIYLFGGNDCYNTIVPRDGAYAEYAQTRTNLAVPQSDLLPLTALSGPDNGGLFGLHPEMAAIQQMFHEGRAAIVANVGPLVRPVNKALYNQPGTLLPAQLYSHSDQTVLWQTPRADATTRTGWGGRLADIFSASNVNQVLSMNVSLQGDNVFQAGEDVAPYFMSAEGVEEIDLIRTDLPNCGPNGHWNRRRCLSFHALLNQSHQHPFERAFAEKTRRTIETSAEVTAALALHPESDAVFQPFRDAFPDGMPHLARQLLMIARMIRARFDLQMSRQLFFAGLGGFDTHDRQLDDHPQLLATLSRSVKAFYDVLEAMALSDSVTTFTGSEFGRTLTNNGDGTDHGWGGHHFVFGGGVNGQRIFGRMPSLALNDNPDDAGWGQIIPTLAVDQYAATLASWYGLADADRDDIFPNLVHMNGPILSIEGPDLGFMQTPG